MSTKLIHNSHCSFFNNEKRSEEKPLGLNFIKEMSSSPINNPHSVKATGKYTPRGDSEADVEYDYNG